MGIFYISNLISIMKNYIILLLLLLPFIAVSQNLSDATTFQKVVELAEKKRKPIILIVSIESSPAFANKVAPHQALKDAEVVKKMKANFVVFEGDYADSTIRKITSTYKVTRFPSFLFLHAEKDLFYTEFGYSSTKDKYLTMLDKALLKSKEKSLSALTKAYAANPADTTSLKQLINKRKQNGISDNAELIEQYVSHLKISDLNNYQTVLFILEAGPLLDGNAYKFAKSNTSVYDKIYKNEPLDKRLAINNAIINNTYNVAVKTRNANKAYQVSSFIRSTWNEDPMKGNKAAELRMLSYYLAVRDTATYLRTATNFYDRYYMAISIDSVRKLDKKERETNMARARQQGLIQPPTKTAAEARIDSLKRVQLGQSIVRTEIVGISSVIPLHSIDLNNAAARFSQIGTKNINYLVKAMTWSKRAIELDPKWPNYNTLAHIYDAMDLPNEALATQKIAIDLARKNSASEQNLLFLTKAYDKMKNKTL
jgi:tetratricopeptide (TPR) repeat protein